MPIFFTTTIHLCFWRNIQSSPFPCLHLSPRPFHKLVPLEAWIYAPVVQCHWMITIHGRHLWHPSKNSLCLWQYIGVAPRKRWPSQGFFFIISTWERSNLMVGSASNYYPLVNKQGTGNGACLCNKLVFWAINVAFFCLRLLGFPVHSERFKLCWELLWRLVAWSTINHHSQRFTCVPAGVQ